MLKLICVFFPAVLSVWLFEAISHKQLTLKAWVYRFCLNAMLCNGFVFVVKTLLTHTSQELLNLIGADMMPAVALRYLIMALPAAVAAAALEALLTKKIDISVGEDEDEKPQ